ncbi:Decaprenyl diphosphate synthase-like protein [Mycena rebaudengoi]|nr:Decaprenyl diphosphate synthase-like protein [Mycena rebaudengoi]
MATFSIRKNATQMFQLKEPVWDPRDAIPSLLLITLISPLGFFVASYTTCLALFVTYWGLPLLIRLQWPIFGSPNILDDLRFNAGASLSLVASMTAFILQNHNKRISLAMKIHSDLYSRPLVRILRTFLYVELALYGSSEEKEQIASWLRWMHQHVQGPINAELRKELGLPDDIDHYGYIDELKAYVMETLTWATIEFQNRFGRRLSSRGRDAVVLEYTCVGMRLGVPRSLLTSTYDDFLISFGRRLDQLDSGCEITNIVVRNIEASVIEAKKSWLTSIMIRCALMVGFTLLPERVQSKYKLAILRSQSACRVQRVLCAVLWAIYPFLMWIPLRGMICLLLVLEPQLRPALRTSLQTIHRMDLLHDRPSVVPTTTPVTASVRPSYLAWLSAGRFRPSVLQMILVRTLEAQLQSTSWTNGIRTWAAYPYSIAETCFEALFSQVAEKARLCRTQLVEYSLFKSGTEAKLPVHIGIIMDGNRRYARQLGQPVLAGHAKGAVAASNVLEWWIKYIPNTLTRTSTAVHPKYLTCWAFSSENFGRAANERDGLFALMAAEFKSLAFTSLVHLFQIRICFIGGDRRRFPAELLHAMDLVEELTSSYDALFLQIAVGYGGREEIVSAVKGLVDQGEDITEQSISSHTYCQQRGIPPVSLIIRTSERRTSGFLLWDTQTAELHFVDKLWPQLTEVDWLYALRGFSGREMRGGK